MPSRTDVILASAGFVIGSLIVSVASVKRSRNPTQAVACQVALETAPDTLGLLIADPPAPCFPYWSAKLRATGFSLADTTTHAERKD